MGADRLVWWSGTLVVDLGSTVAWRGWLPGTYIVGWTGPMSIFTLFASFCILETLVQNEDLHCYCALCAPGHRQRPIFEHSSSRTYPVLWLVSYFQPVQDADLTKDLAKHMTTTDK